MVKYCDFAQTGNTAKVYSILAQGDPRFFIKQFTAFSRVFEGTFPLFLAKFTSFMESNDIFAQKEDYRKLANWNTTNRVVCVPCVVCIDLNYKENSKFTHQK